VQKVLQQQTWRAVADTLRPAGPLKAEASVRLKTACTTAGVSTAAGPLKAEASVRRKTPRTTADVPSAASLPEGKAPGLQHTASTAGTGTDTFVVGSRATDAAGEAAAKPCSSVKETSVRPRERRPRRRGPVAMILDGRAKSAEWLQELRVSVDEVTAALRRSPGLCIIAVGSRPDSQLYVSKKEEACEQVWPGLL
jgi:hypothetical protein